MARILHHHVQLMPLGSSKLHCCAEGPGLAIGFPAPNRVKGNQRHKVLVGGHGPPQEADSSRFYSCPGTVQRHQHWGPGDSGALGHGAVLTPTTPPGIRVCMLSLFSHVRLCDSRLHCPWNSPGKNTGVGDHALLQGIFPTQGSNPDLLHLPHLQAGS